MTYLPCSSSASLATLALMASLVGGVGCKTSTEACESLSEDAQKELAQANAKNLACSVDADCAIVLVSQSGLCAAPCGILSSNAAASSSAAADACVLFEAERCPSPRIGCPYSGTFLCAGGTCAGYTVGVTMPSTIKAGSCLALTLEYTTAGPSPVAPHDLPLMIQVNNATLFADAACTKPVSSFSSTSNIDQGTITLPGGSKSVVFGFQASMAGPGLLDVEGQDNSGGSVSFTAN